MRTTVTIPDDVYDDVRVRAARSGRPISSVIEEALRLYLLGIGELPQAPVPSLPTIRSGGVRPGIDLDDMSAVRELMDEQQAIDAVR